MALDDTLDVGDTGHVEAHEALHALFNTLDGHGPGDPHPQYLTDAEGDALVAAHEAAGDPHPAYQKESEKAAASGYPSLDGTTKVPIAQLPTGTTGTTVALGNAAAALVTAHEAAGDPHPTYLTAAEGDALFLTPIEGDAAYEPAGTVATHAAAGDPHTGYRLESADHSHQSTGLQGGKIDHGAALDGLTDNDHAVPYDAHTFIFSKSGVLTTSTGAHRLYLPWNITIAQVEISVGTAPTGAALIVDVNVSGTTIFTTQSNRPEIAISGFVDQSGTIEDPDHDDGQYITVDVDQVGSTIAGSDLTVIIWYRRR